MQAWVSTFLLRISREDSKLHIVIIFRLIVSTSALLQATRRASKASSGVQTNKVVEHHVEMWFRRKKHLTRTCTHRLLHFYSCISLLWTPLWKYRMLEVQRKYAVAYLGSLLREPHVVRIIALYKQRNKINHGDESCWNLPDSVRQQTM